MKHRLFPGIFLVLILVTTSCTTEPWQEYDFHGSLYKLLIYGKNYRNDIVVSDLPSIMQERMHDFLERRTHHNSQIELPDMTNKNREYKMVTESGYNKKYSIELGIYSLIDTPGIADSAYSYAQKAKLFFEWEGFSDGPLTEADFTETYIEIHPNSIINPYLLLFLLHRYRAAFECTVAENDSNGQAVTAAKYNYYLKQARKEQDPLIGAIANDMNRQDYTYYNVWKHPDPSIIIKLPIVYFSPNEFPKLPTAIGSYLTRNGYTIPQTFIEKQPHNVISGSILKNGVNNWAILASHEGESKILVFETDTTQAPLILAARRDLGYVQTIDNGKKGYSRYISIANPADVKRSRKHKIESVPIDHDGIEDAFIEKGSDVWYFNDGEWIRHLGAD
ncbi:MAG: hypothetical protein K9N34_01760 [Candidatus Marinimicrobia bacterium]|nr:hypothetical protein [Candidatus Neomarinimicrobiota bacterium]MCF7839624.1 hypothetical protein [Candidatus Neomarinimicrobiota bacterium]MCF7902511.1 hypothetical protein [Candidatus Neomarinimicrobiota bacterium]